MFDIAMPGPDTLCGLSDAELVDGIVDWSRATAAAEARKSAAIAELVRRRVKDEHPDWACDDWDACAAELSCALTVSHGRASSQMDLAITLRDRFPQLGALFLAGELSSRTVETIARRTDLVTDDEALAALDTTITAAAVHWGPLSQYKLELAIDAAVQRHDPHAVRRARDAARGRDFTVGDPHDLTGTTSVWGRLSTPDAALLRQAVAALANSVCDDDPRTRAQRRADALGALAARATRLPCRCGNPACPAGATGDDPVAARFVIHILADPDVQCAAADPEHHGGIDFDDDESPAEAQPVADPETQPDDEIEESRDTPATMGHPRFEAYTAYLRTSPPPPPPPLESPAPPPPSQESPAPPPPPQESPAPPPPSQESPAPPARPPDTAPAHGIGLIPGMPGGGLLPTAAVADLIARGTKVCPLATPGPQPEKSYRPSAALARFIRFRDLTCRHPGCDRPASQTDIDHTIPWPAGVTHPSNLTPKCRKHHLLKTFWPGWSNVQLPDGTLLITTPTGHTYTTKPCAALLFPSFDTTTAALRPPKAGSPRLPGHTLSMPTRKQPRAKTRAERIRAERALNDASAAGPGEAPPF
jgi:hypothetical protein